MKSRKLVVMVTSVLALVVNAVLAGSPIPNDQLMIILTPVAAWLLGQGIADHGEQGKAIAEQRAIKTAPKEEATDAP